MAKLKNDASSTISGIIYQFYIALEYCFNLKEGEKLFIEKYGDVSISNSKQIEVKKYSDKLTDTHQNIWKTLNNWLHYSFNCDLYKELILLTTQEYGKRSKFIGWNNKNVEEKYKILSEIFTTMSEKDSDNLSIIKDVMKIENKNKLMLILDKFIIFDSSPISEEQYNDLLDMKAGHIPKENRALYIKSLLGFIISPEVTSSSQSWEIEYSQFSEEQQILTEQHCKNTIIFPKIKKEITNQDIEENKQHLFVKKIDDINYLEVKNEAIEDYLKTIHLLFNEMKGYIASKDSYDSYNNELITNYNIMYRRAKRNVTNISEIEKESQNFYDDIMGSETQPFANFNDTARYFRNGLYQSLADDSDKNIIWNLKGSETDV